MAQADGKTCLPGGEERTTIHANTCGIFDAICFPDVDWRDSEQGFAEYGWDYNLYQQTGQYASNAEVRVKNVLVFMDLRVWRTSKKVEMRLGQMIHEDHTVGEWRRETSRGLPKVPHLRALIYFVFHRFEDDHARPFFEDIPLKSSRKLAVKRVLGVVNAARERKIELADFKYRADEDII
ncbi:hypothetical protein BC567DRAFT_251502 [Phyllosticta citribraziliensis]